jgi:hypothetical protein
MLVEALVTQSAVEAFEKAILHQLAGCRSVASAGLSAGDSLPMVGNKTRTLNRAVSGEHKLAFSQLWIASR